jgi:hypothetical protein
LSLGLQPVRDRGTRLPDNHETLAVNMVKAMAACQAALVSRRSHLVAILRSLSR